MGCSSFYGASLRLNTLIWVDSFQIVRVWTATAVERLDYDTVRILPAINRNYYYHIITESINKRRAV